jgi:hypothetical protein
MPESQKYLLLTLAGAALAAGILGGWLPAMLRGLGLLGWAAGMVQKFSLFTDPRINWETVWLVVSLFGAAGLLQAPARALPVWIAARRRMQARHWTMPATAAVAHIRLRSAYGAALGHGDNTRLDEICLQALLEAARGGRLPLAAIPTGRATLREIAPGELRRLTPRIHDGSLLLRDAAGRIVFSAVMTEPAVVLRLWPSR